MIIHKLRKISFPSILFQHTLFCFLVSMLMYDGYQAAHAQASFEINADKQMDYADYCFENQDYMTAAAEYKKFIYFFPKDERVVIAEYKIGMSYFHDKFYIKALNQFTHILDQNGLTDAGIQSAFMISRCYQRVRNYPSAIDNLVYLKQMTADTDLIDRVYYYLGWLYLESGDFDQARSAFSSISVPNQLDSNTKTLADHLSGQGNIPQKNPITAGILSIIPGGGYLYCGRYRDALVSFLINSVLIYGVYESFDKELYAIGGILAVVELGFYAGNIYGGVSSAHKFNKIKQNEFVQNLKKEFNADISIKINSNDILLGMTYHF
ncbi:MAG: tetratricopeptide repeat protein [Desulfobacteraceae bacterium]|nr:tetratricopeptide repeat protein [Desulfobacteraceae bacterium]MBC2755771.1 tetratricopeptide repeat protein [Desulfobacteraceae bacterium]